MNEERYKEALNNLKVSEDFNEKTLTFLQGKSVETRKNVIFMKKNNIKFKRIYVVSMVFIAVFAITFGMKFLNSNSSIELAHSTGNVKVQYINKIPYEIREMNDLVTLSEYGIFNKYNTSIFKGEVQDIKNIKLKFGKGNEFYQSVATIKIDEVYRGGEKVGDIVEVRMPCPIGNNEWVEDTDVVSAMRVGTMGIFMPMKYDGTEYREENGAKLCLKDISNYGFMDGVRYAFIQTENGILYDEFSYESLSGESTLEDVKEYILKMIKQVK